MLKLLPLFVFCLQAWILKAQAPFEDKVLEAFSFLEAEQSTIEQVAKKFEVPRSAALAIGFPELIRYNLVKDIFETTALEILYEDLGSREVDFSIGPFQMKPSFVEELERTIREFPTAFAALQWVANYKSTDVKKQRKERLERMQSFEWQLNYLFSFYQVAEVCFSDETLCDESEKVAFFASAYNLGFYTERALIRRWIGKEIFPYGKKYNGPQLAYAALAVRYYKEQNPSKTEIICVNE